MAKNPIDPLRVRLIELTEEFSEHNSLLRDYASTPGNAWLAKSELQTLGLLMGELEVLIEEIKQADAEDGYS